MRDWLKGLFGNKNDEEWESEERRQTYRVLHENSNAVKIESYEVEIQKNESGDERIEIRDFLWAGWYRKNRISTWPNPVAQAYMVYRFGDEFPGLDDYWSHPD